MDDGVRGGLVTAFRPHVAFEFDHVAKTGVKLLVPPGVRFPNTAHEHQTFMVADPSGNVVEFKCYVRPECSY